MKLLRLTITNIASIEHADIDFASGPLSGEALFLICGPTGAGKSTLLDAISLALYDTTPRLAAAPNEQYNDVAAGFRSGAGEPAPVGVSEPRLLMRRGAAYCEISLLFASESDGRVYRSLWSCSRARRRHDGKIQPSVWMLYDHASDTPITSKKSDTKNAIRSLVGLDFDQFCRTTLLAQGAFAKFLGASADDKSRILEHLTGTAIYSAVSKGIYRHFRESDEAVRISRMAAEGIVLLTEEEITAINQTMVRLQATAESLRVQATESDRLLKSIDCCAEASARLREARSEAALAHAASDTDSHREAISTVHDWDKSGPQRDLLAQIGTARRQLEMAEKRAADNTLWFKACDALDHLCGLADSTVKALNTVQGRIAARAPLLTLIAATSTIQDDVDRLGKLISAISRSEADVRTALAKAKADSEALGKARSKSEADIRDVDTMSKAITALEKDPALTGLEPARASLATINDLTAKMQQASTLLASYNERRRNVASLQTSVERLSATSLEAAERFTTAADEAARASKLAEEADTLYRRQSLALADGLDILRAGLSLGDTCPLCGQVVNAPLHTEEELRQMLLPLAEHRDSAKMASDKANKIMLEADTRRRTAAADLEREQRLLREACNLSDTTLKSVRANDTAAPFITGDGHADTTALLAAIEANRAHAAALEGAIRTGSDIAARVSSLKAAHSALQQKIISDQETVAKLQESVQRHHAQAQAHRAAHDTLLDQRAHLDERLRHLLSPLLPDTTTDRAPDYTIAMSRLGRIAHEHRQDTLDAERLSAELSAIRSVTDSCLRKRDLLTPRYGTAERTCPLCQAPACSPAETARIWDQLISETAAADENRRIAALQLGDLQHRFTQLCSAESALPSERVTALMALADRIEPLRLTIRQTELRLAESAKAVSIAAAGWSSAIGNLRQITGLETMPDDAMLSELRVATAEQAAVIAGNLQSTIEERSRCQARIDTDTESRARHAGALARLQQLTAERDRWGRLNTLFGSHDGKCMRGIAQSYILDELTRHANVYLRRLSARYMLRCQPGQLTLLVEDLAAGGEVRPAASLSGGESFVVSLALALGLPALSGKAVAFDIIFIDEGFGTLDASTLDQVISTLERLHRTGGRRVGIISHVDSLRERIPARISVTPRAGAGSEIVILC